MRTEGPEAQSPHAARLGPKRRSRAIEVMRERELDVLVIGGGITGTGVALDAVTRGLDVGVIEARDWGSGTSSRSSKLVHGGIRYLEQLNFSLVQEALHERGLLMQKLAPHLVSPVAFLYPLTQPVIERLYVGAGMFLYDLFARVTGRPGVPFHRHLSRRRLRRVAPGLRLDAFRGGLVYYDGQVDDARLVITIARTAAHYGAHLANRVRCEGFLREEGRVTGVIARDLETDEVCEIRAKHVVNATGVWTDETQSMLGERGKFHVRASKGVHIVVARDRFASQTGLLLRTEKSVLFVIPWGQHWLIGTTDTDWNLDKAHPAATATDIDYLLERVNSVLELQLTRADVQGVYAGLRPLLSGESDDTSKLSREHTVAQVAPGLTVVAGGKLTTYRVMARDTIDAVASALAVETGRTVQSADAPDAAHTMTRDRAVRVPGSVTADTPLVGAEGLRAAWNRRGRDARRAGLTQLQIEHLLRRYGSCTSELLTLLRERQELKQPLAGAEDTLAVEVVYAVTHESAKHLDDVLCRRTHIAVTTPDRGVRAAATAATLMATELGWSESRTAEEVQRYLERVDAELASQEEVTDEAADRVRTRG